jgi:folate-dependent tRNA-U54 methylase TrmFO/GidA
LALCEQFAHRAWPRVLNAFARMVNPIAAANQRYLQALSAAPLKGKGVAPLDALCRPRTRNGRRVARFNPLNPADLALFKAVTAGEHAIVGFRNNDIAARLYRRPPADTDERHRRCERVSRLLVKLRGHGLIAKVPRAQLYRVTPYGHRVMTAALSLHDHQYPSDYLAAA